MVIGKILHYTGKILYCGLMVISMLMYLFIITHTGNKTVSDVKRLYFKLREEVFSQTDMARRSQALDGFLQAHLGTQMKMSDIQHPK